MKVSELTNEQFRCIVDTFSPVWVANVNPEFLFSYKPELAFTYRPDWVKEHHLDWVKEKHPSFLENLETMNVPSFIVSYLFRGKRLS